MIKTQDIRQREKSLIDIEVQMADTVLLTKEMMILNHMFDQDEKDREVVAEIMINLSKKLASLSLKRLRLLYLYNDEQTHKTKVKWNKAGVIEFRGVVYKLVSPLELTTYRARRLLRIHLLSAINYRTNIREEKIDKGEFKIVGKGKIDEKTNLKPDWMDW